MALGSVFLKIGMLVVLPLKQIEHEGAPALLLLVGLTINAAWGVGTALLRRLFPA